MAAKVVTFKGCDIFFSLEEQSPFTENYENGCKIMCLNADDWQLDVKNVQEFLKQNRYWGS
jgi:hypothetical protein